MMHIFKSSKVLYNKLNVHSVKLARRNNESFNILKTRSYCKDHKHFREEDMIIKYDLDDYPIDEPHIDMKDTEPKANYSKVQTMEQNYSQNHTHKYNHEHSHSHNQVQSRPYNHNQSHPHNHNHSHNHDVYGRGQETNSRGTTFVSSYYRIDEQQIFSFLERKSLDFRLSPDRSQVIIKECPFCHDTKGHASNQFKLYIYKDNGRYYCFRCGSNGSWYVLFIYCS